jgi:hypothetical protein
MDNYIMDSFRIGAVAEELAAQRIMNAGWNITDVRKDLEYQKIDIDYICSGVDDEWSVDIKTDRCYRTGNYFFETVANVELDKQGWAYTSAAEYILIVYNTGAGYELHVISLKLTSEWLHGNAWKCRTVTNSTKRENGTVYHSQGIIVNRSKFQRESGAVMQVLNLSKEEAA